MRRKKLVVIGSGSLTFTRPLIRDILSVPELQNMEIVFTDIDAENMECVRQLCQRDIDHNGLAVCIRSTTDRRDAFRDADYVVSCVRIGGLEGFRADVEIPLRYGVDQCVGDTICAGGLLYGQRSVSAVLDFCQDIREVAAPGCILFNYANPNAIVTWAANEYGGVPTVGICHGVTNGALLLAEILEVPFSKLDFTCVGINHQTWYTKVSYEGKDLTGSILHALETHPVYSRTEKVRIDVLRRFGYFCTESNGHLSEYLPWYRKRHDEILKWVDVNREWIDGETCGYYRHITDNRNWFNEEYSRLLTDPPMEYGSEYRGNEHLSYILEGLETGRVYRGYFNVINHGIISNLPANCVVEAPGYCDRNGISMPYYGELPEGCASVCKTSIQIQGMAVKAAVQGNIELLKQAVLLDPLTGSVLDPAEVWQMVDEMLVATEQWLPRYRKGIKEAKERLESSRIVPYYNGYQGAARLKNKSADEFSKTMN